MAISRVTTWSAGQVLTAAALNAEFDNIINNALSLVSPWTADMAAGAFRLTGLSLGTAGSPSLQFTGSGSNDGIFSPGNDRVSIVTGAVARLEVAAEGQVFINDTFNGAQHSPGLTVNQGAGDDELICGKSTDVGHLMTDLTEPDSYLAIRKRQAVSGGVEITGYSSGTEGLVVRGFHTTDDGVHNTTARGAVVITGGLRLGTNVGAMGAATNILVVGNASQVRFIFDADGSSYEDVGTAWTNYDDRDDVGLLNLLAAHVTRLDDPLRASFDGWLSQNRATLQEMNMVTFNDGPGEDGSIFLNTSRLAMLHTGAIRQLGAKLSRCERALTVAGIALTD